MMRRVTAVFDTESQAEQAITALRTRGLRDEQLSVLTRRDEGVLEDERRTVATPQEETKDEGDTTAKRTGKGLLAGAGVGAIFGLAAAFIPGVGPFITAGWLASTLGATAGGAAAGAIVGGASGAIAGALAKAGYSEPEARYYGEAVERGDVLVAVDTSTTTLTDDEVMSILRQYGGRSASESEQRRVA